MADTHTLQEIIEKIIQATLLKAHPVGSYWLTESDDDPNTLFGGGVGACQGRVQQCSDDTHPAGTDIEAGLPNITGEPWWGLYCYSQNGEASTSGAFSHDAMNTTGVLSMGTSQHTCCMGQFHFNASNCSSIYGKSDTVQPETHVVNVWKRIS